MVFINCDTQFKEYCVSMSAYGLNQKSNESDKTSVCRDCLKHNFLLREFFGFKYDFLERYISDSEKKEALLHFDRLKADFDIQGKIDYLPIIQYAVYDILLQFKKNNLEFTEEEKNAFNINLKNSILTYFGATNVMKKFDPDVVLIYNNAYGVNRVFTGVAEHFGKPVYLLHAGENLSERLATMIFTKHHIRFYRSEQRRHWAEHSKLPVSSEEAKQVSNHFLEVIEGKHFIAYSASKSTCDSVKDFFGVSTNQKLVVATLSSYDERFAAEVVGMLKEEEELVFSSLIEWVQNLIRFFGEEKDMFLVVRVHPREFPNKRETVRSKHSLEFERLFQNLPSNVKINYPSDNISIYDIAKEADLFLNAWSSVGEEMSMLGIPVLLYSPNLAIYPASINVVASDKEDYFAKIKSLIRSGWDINYSLFSFRWHAVKFNRSVYRISDNFQYRERNEYIPASIGYFRKLKNRIIWKWKRKKFESQGIVYNDFVRDCLDYKPFDAKQFSLQLNRDFNTRLDCYDEKPVRSEDELIYIKREIRRIRESLFSQEEISKNEKPLLLHFNRFLKD